MVCCKIVGIYPDIHPKPSSGFIQGFIARIHPCFFALFLQPLKTLESFSTLGVAKRKTGQEAQLVSVLSLVNLGEALLTSVLPLVNLGEALLVSVSSLEIIKKPNLFRFCLL